MKNISKLFGALLLGAGAIGLSGCATGLSTQVSRHQAMPTAAGQTFYVVPAHGHGATLEFNRYAALVSDQLRARGYTPAGAPQLATMLVKLDYGVDQGQTEETQDPLARSRYGYGRYNDPFYRGYYDPFFRSRYSYRDPFYDPYWGTYSGRPYYSRFGYWGQRSPFYYGWDDPFWYASPYAGYGPGQGGAYGQPIRSYTVYKSHLDMQIVRRADNAPLFDGHAKARSQTDEAGVLVPNLIEAMFTGFPGKSGETVRITVPAKKRS
jgi:hypothetical protein